MRGGDENASRLLYEWHQGALFRFVLFMNGASAAQPGVSTLMTPLWRKACQGGQSWWPLTVCAHFHLSGCNGVRRIRFPGPAGTRNSF